MDRKKTSSQTEIFEREPYEPPRIVYREPLEAVAVLCSPVGIAKGDQGTCPQGPLFS